MARLKPIIDEVSTWLAPSKSFEIFGPSEFKKLCKVRKNIYNCTLSILYQAIILGVAEEWELKDFDLERLRTCSTVNDHLRYVKHGHRAADFHYRLKSPSVC